VIESPSGMTRQTPVCVRTAASVPLSVGPACPASTGLPESSSVDVAGDPSAPASTLPDELLELLLDEVPCELPAPRLDAVPELGFDLARDDVAALVPVPPLEDASPLVPTPLLEDASALVPVSLLDAPATPVPAVRLDEASRLVLEALPDAAPVLLLPPTSVVAGLLELDEQAANNPIATRAHDTTRARYFTRTVLGFGQRLPSTRGT